MGVNKEVKIMKIEDIKKALGFSDNTTEQRIFNIIVKKKQLMKNFTS